MATLTNEQVVEFRRRHHEGEKVAPLCREFGVTTTIGERLVTGKTFTLIGGPVRGNLSKRGADNGMAKLTPDSVREIRRLHASREIGRRALAGRFGVSVSNIDAILERRTWKHLED